MLQPHAQTVWLNECPGVFPAASWRHSPSAFTAPPSNAQRRWRAAKAIGGRGGGETSHMVGLSSYTSPPRPNPPGYGTMFNHIGRLLPKSCSSLGAMRQIWAHLDKQWSAFENRMLDGSANDFDQVWSGFDKRRTRLKPIRASGEFGLVWTKVGLVTTKLGLVLTCGSNYSGLPSAQRGPLSTQ